MDDTVAMKKRLSRVRIERDVTTSDIITINEHLADLSQKVYLPPGFFFFFFFHK